MAEENKMSIYEVTDEKTGVTLQLEGMGPPTKEQVDAIFANHYKNNPKEPTGFDPRVLAAQLAGAPVDVVTKILNTFGLDIKDHFLGSQSIANISNKTALPRQNTIQNTTGGNKQIETLLESAQGPSEAITSLLTSAALEIPAGVVGTAATLLPGPKGSGADAVRLVQDLAYQPREKGQETIANLSNVISDVTPEFVKNIAGSIGDAASNITEKTNENLGPLAATAVSVVPLVALEAVPGGLALKAARNARRIRIASEEEVALVNNSIDDVKDKISDNLAAGVSPEQTKFEIKNIVEAAPSSPFTDETINLLNNDNDPLNRINELADIALDERTVNEAKIVFANGSRRVQDSVAARAAIAQGLDEGVADLVLRSSEVTKDKMQKMVNIRRIGKGDVRYRALNRASDVVGGSVLNRLNVVFRANKEATEQLENVAQTLKGKTADTSSAFGSFFNKLNGMGITFKQDGKLDYDGSDIDGLEGIQKTIDKLMPRIIRVQRSGDAYEAHRLKTFIDETVKYGTKERGLDGKAKTFIKQLRREIDKSLDSKFAEYEFQNTKYSETRSVIDDIQELAGKKIDFSKPNVDKNFGVLFRGILSNNKSRTRLINSLNELQNIAVKQGGVFNDDIISLLSFSDELESLFGPSASTSLQGEVGKAVSQAVRKDLSGMVIDAGKLAVDKVKGINDTNKFLTLNKLLSEAMNKGVKKKVITPQ